MSEYNAILDLGMHFPVVFCMFRSACSITLSVKNFGPWGGNAWTPNFSFYDCPCTCNTLRACALTRAILSPVRVGLAIPTHGMIHVISVSLWEKQKYSSHEEGLSEKRLNPLVQLRA